MRDEATIAAIATGVGGSLAIIRLSGPRAVAIADQVWQGRRPLAQCPPRTLALGRALVAGAVVDHCLAVRMPGPRSHTGEDVAELHLHGGPLIARTVLQALLAAGARHAEPGEFTRRAFLNGKLDLTQAEAVLDLIRAHSDRALHAAQRQLAGTLGQRVGALYDEVTALLAEVEVRMDFVDEALDWEPPECLVARLAALQAAIADLRRSRHDGEILRHGLRLVIAGAPNAGKSSLLNRLLGRDRAIVTPLPGTTRDTLEEPAHIRGIPLQLVDTAGLRDATDLVEQHGIARSLDALAQAHLVLWLIDVTQPLPPQLPPTDRLAGKPLLVALNKVDLRPGFTADLPGAPPTVAISATTGAGLDALYDALETLVWGAPHPTEPDIAISARHDALLEHAAAQLAAADAVLAREAYDLLAVHLRTALDNLGQIIGRTLQPDLLDTIFHQFCIGK